MSRVLIVGAGFTGCTLSWPLGHEGSHACSSSERTPRRLGPLRQENVRGRALQLQVLGSASARHRLCTVSERGLRLRTHERAGPLPQIGLPENRLHDNPYQEDALEGERHGRVCAVVVTHNRKHMLERCLAALREQSRPVDGVIVVDNASTDGTSALVRERFPEVRLLPLRENLGGAGGFNRGMAWAHALGFDWQWLMDDDTFARPKALEALLAGADRAPGSVPPLLLASKVLWRDGSLHPMNLPVPRWRWPGELALGVDRRLLLVRYVTFVSVAIRREAIDRFGLPLAEYFIWTDDVEYTSRVLRRERGYLVPESQVDHWTETAHSAGSDASGRFYFHVRNSLLLLRGSSLEPAERYHYLRFWLTTLRQYLQRNRCSGRALLVVGRGIRDGLRGRAVR